MKQQSKLRLGAVIMVAVLLLSYVIYQIVQASKAGLETQIAMQETVYETIDTQCFILRDEKYLMNEASGTVISFAKNGERVGSGDTVSMVFSDSEDADTYTKIADLKKEIAHYEALSGQANLQAMDISSLDKKINKNLVSLLDTVDKRSFSDLNKCVEEFRSSSTAKQVATGEELKYDETLAKLKNELKTLRVEDLNYKTVKSDRAGYYISGADGFEDTIKYSSVDSLTAEDIQKAFTVKPDTVPASVAGRTVGAFEWYILTVVDTAKTANLSTGQELTVNFPYSGIADLTVYVHKIGEKDKDTTILILKCSLMNEALASIRNEEVQIITQSYKGYKISNSAIRTVNGETGVYVISGNLCTFRKVHIVYQTDTFAIVDNPEGENGFIRLYDKVIVKGVEIYDNKLV